MANGIVALVPARGGSKRIANKNIKPLAGHPLIAYTIAAAYQSGMFAEVMVCSEDGEIIETAKRYGAHVSHPRPRMYAEDHSPDIDWISWLFVTGQILSSASEFAILRPTSPFRSAETIQRAYGDWQHVRGWADSMRAIQPVREHPAKMWVHLADSSPTERDEIYPAFGGYFEEFVNPPAHSRPTQQLGQYYVQNASLEIAFCTTVTELHSISGANIAPFWSNGYEGFDINTPEDWILAEALVERGLAVLPEVRA